MNYTLGKTLFTQEQINLKIRELGSRINNEYFGSDLLMVGILKGAVLFYADLARTIEVPLTMDFMMVSSYGSSTESTGEVRILKDLDVSVEKKHVLLVEDIVDTGLTLHYLKTFLGSRNPLSIKICTFLDKPDRRLVDVELNYVGFEIPDEFVVGYGLDYNEMYRNLPSIVVLKNDVNI